jgi:hypothetical protein
MSEVHVTVTGPRNEVTIVAHNPGVSPTAKGAGQPIVTTKDASGKTTSTSGQVPGTGVMHNNPA